MPNRANGVPTTAHFEVLGIEIGGCASALARTVRRCDVTVIAPRYDIPWYGQRMKVDKISISFEAELGDEVRAAASKAGMGCLLVAGRGGRREASGGSAGRFSRYLGKETWPAYGERAEPRGIGTRSPA